MLSSRSVDELPNVDELKRISQSLAMLDAIMMPDWEYRYYSFDANWSDEEMLASMRNGSGDSFFILFNSSGAIIKGFAHESAMAAHTADTGEIWPGVLDGVPPEFEAVLNDPALVPEETTFCIWRKRGDARWQTGKIKFPEAEDPDGSEELLSILDGKPETYATWASEYYERTIPVDAVKAVYAHEPLTQKLVSRLNPDCRFEDLEGDIDEIGYHRKAV
jgi:hypothetical protein